jgi:hypothetical protein
VTRLELLDARTQLRAAIVAVEDWQGSYKADPVTFALLTYLEAQLETNVAEYLHELAQRVPAYVDWERLPKPVIAAAGPVANNDDVVWSEEEKLLTSAVLAVITDLVATGAVAGEAVYGIPLGYSSLEFASLDDAIMQAARKYTAQMVSNVTATTRKIIRESVAKSVALGENADMATVRLMKVIDNPIRAQLISQTEPVNAYQTGLKHYAVSTGAKTKKWDGLIGACPLCQSAIKQGEIAIDKLFTLSNGKQVDRPACHPRDRCGIIYGY